MSLSSHPRHEAWAAICCCHTVQVSCEADQHGVGKLPSQCQAPPCRGTTHHTSPRPDLREKLRVRLTPSQLPGSSLMRPTLVFQVVQFTSSTLQGKGWGLGGQLSKARHSRQRDGQGLFYGHSSYPMHHKVQECSTLDSWVWLCSPGSHFGTPQVFQCLILETLPPEAEVGVLCP